MSNLAWDQPPLSLFESRSRPLRLATGTCTTTNWMSWKLTDRPRLHSQCGLEAVGLGTEIGLAGADACHPALWIVIAIISSGIAIYCSARQCCAEKQMAQTSSPKCAITAYDSECYNREGVCANCGYNGKNSTNPTRSGPGLVGAFRLWIRSQVLALADVGDVGASEIPIYL